MTIKSIPPASSHLALMPVPAPPPMIGTPASTFARKRSMTARRDSVIVRYSGRRLMKFSTSASANAGSLMW